MAICNCTDPTIPSDDCFIHSGCYTTPFQFTLSRDKCIFSNYAEELATIGGADLNVYKLLGIHEQTNMTDLTGFGKPISSGDQPAFEAIHAFDSECKEWRSLARGPEVTNCGFLGYDFGEVKLANGRNQYSHESFVQKHITTIGIQQSSIATERVTKARVERSPDGIRWFGTAIITLPDDDEMNYIGFKQSAAVRWWRVRPITFNGGDTDYWMIKKMELMDYSMTRLDNIQDEWGFLENRDREYSTCPVALKGVYDLSDTNTDLTRLGLELPETTTFKIHFNSMVSKLGRPMVVGDIIEIPSQTEYSANMRGIKKYVEVTDISWASDGFTPGWNALILRVVSAPLMAKQENMDIVGDFVKEKLMSAEAPGWMDIDQSSYSALPFIANDRINSAAKSMVQERGEDQQHLGTIDDAFLEAAADLGTDLGKISQPHSNDAYTRDALPPGGAKYSEGPELPPIEKAKDGQYARVFYPGKEEIPARLYKFSAKKNRWVYLESDERWKTNLNSTRAARFLNGKDRVNVNDTV